MIFQEDMNKEELTVLTKSPEIKTHLLKQEIYGLFRDGLTDGMFKIKEVLERKLKVKAMKKGILNLTLMNLILQREQD